MSPTFLGNKPFPPGAKRRLVAQYGLTDQDTMLSGRADECMYELIAHLDMGREVVESRDEQRHVWMYKVYELEDEVYGPLATPRTPEATARPEYGGVLGQLIGRENERQARVRFGVSTVPPPPVASSRQGSVLERGKLGGNDT